MRRYDTGLVSAVQGKTFEEYLGDETLRLATERRIHSFAVSWFWVAKTLSWYGRCERNETVAESLVIGCTNAYGKCEAQYGRE